jgi:flagellar hook-associated protein 2
MRAGAKPDASIPAVAQVPPIAADTPVEQRRKSQGKAMISSTGLGSGLDVNAIVSELMRIESRPLGLLQTAQKGLDTRLSTFGSLQGRMATLRDRANELTSPTLWNQTTARSQNEAAVRVSSSGGAVTGNYAVQVERLAASQTIASAAFGSAASTLSEGTLTIELGRWDGEPAPTGFTAKADSTPVQVTIGPDDTSLAAIRDKINAAGAGVTASIITDANGARLALRSTETGAENAFRITATETADDGDGATGLSALGFDATAASPMARSQSAANAQARINGIEISSAGNTLDGVLDGVTLTLLQPTAAGADVEVSVAPDTEAVKTAITAFVSAFNEVASFIREQTKYDEASKKGGVLQGDRVVTGLQSQLRGLFNQESSASAVFSSLSDIGIGFRSDGTLEVKGSQLDAALDNLPELRKLIAADGADAAGSGFMDRVKDFSTAVLGADGSFETRTESLNRQIADNRKRQEAMEQRLNQTETRLLRQYQALDGTMSQLNGLSSYLTQQLASLNLNKR